MEINYIQPGYVTDLSQLIRAMQPMEELDKERNQEDNQKVLNFVNAFLDVLDLELATPKTYKEYVFGKKESFVRSQMISRLELVASRILEKKMLGCSTLNLEDLNFLQEELNFVVDLYYLLVTSLVDLTSIRKKDISDGDLYDQLFDVIEIHMSFFGAYPELKVLVDELHERKDDYPDYPNLQERIKNLLKYSPVQDGDFLFTPSRSVSDYVTGDVLVSIHPESDLTSISVGELPDGVAINSEDGHLYVSDEGLLQPGNYNVLLETADEIGGVTQHHLELAIGSDDIPKYEVAPYRIIEDYFQGDVLARPVVQEGAMPIAFAEWSDETPEVPNGISLDPRTGIIVVEDEDLLEVGVYPVVVILSTQKGTQSRHEFVLSLKQDRKAVYTFYPSKLVQDYKKGDVLASVSDDDGKIIAARKNRIPSGMKISNEGSIEVSDPERLRSGTHIFNVLTKNEKLIEAVKTLYITLDAAPNPFFYDTSGVKPIDELNIGDVIAELNSRDETVASKVLLQKGVMPPGTILMKDGNIQVSDPNKLLVGNYDLHFRVLVDVDGTDLERLLEQKAEKEALLEQKNEQLEELNDQLIDLNSSLIQFNAEGQYAINLLLEKIEEIEKQIETATGEELEELTRLRDAVRAELDALVENLETEYNERVNEISGVQERIDMLRTEIDTLHIELVELGQEILRVRSGRWDEYEVRLLLTFEEDNESAWHLEIPKDWDEYLNNELVAQIIDCDGHAFSEIIEGALPSGMVLEAENGMIRITNKDALTPGEYVLKTRSTDKKKGTTDHRLALIVGGALVDGEETFELFPAKPVNNYLQDEIIGYPYNINYEILSVRVSMGILPGGVEVNPVSGELFIGNTELLKAGEYEGIQLKTVDSSGATHYHELNLTLLRETTFNVIVADPKPLKEYAEGDVLISIFASSRTLQGIQIVSGELVSGTAVNSSSGRIYVKSARQLREGDYSIDILMAETNGASDQRTVNYSIGIASDERNISWTQTDPVVIEQSKDGDIIAEPLISEGRLIAAVSGKLPGWLLVNEVSGIFSIGSVAEMATGVYVIQVELYDELKNSYSESVTINVEGGTLKVVEITPNVAAPADFHTLLDGDTLATLNPQDEISSVSLADGELSQGKSIDDKTGKIYVSDRMLLQRITETIGLNVALENNPEKQVISIPLREKPIPDFSIAENARQFALELPNRLDLFKTQYLNARIIKSVNTYWKQVLSWADTQVENLSNPDIQSSYFSGERDSSNYKFFITVSQPIIAAIESGVTTSVSNALVRLYNELFVSSLAISLYRGKDISSSKSDSVTVMYTEMRKQLEIIESVTNTRFVRQNAELMRPYVKRRFKNLYTQFALFKS